MIININGLARCLAVSVATMVLVACDNGGSAGANDATAPKVTATNPEQLATDVARDTVLSVTFSEDLFAKSIDSASFTLNHTTEVDGAVSYDPLTNVATFTPSANLAMLEQYTATLSSSISDVSGNVLEETYEWSFSTADGAWQMAEKIELNDFNYKGSIDAAFDQHGNAMAVWHQRDSSNNDKIWANQFVENGWGTASSIDVSEQGYSLNPQIAFDGSGNAIVVWEYHNGAVNSISAIRYDGSNWSSVETISISDTADKYNPKVEFDKQGKALAIWRGESNGHFSIWTNYFNGETWRGPELIEDLDTGDAYSPNLRFDNNGNAIAAWRQRDGSLDSIWVNKFEGESWGEAFLLENNNTDSTGDAEIAFSGSDNSIWVLWQFGGGFGGASNIWARRHDGSSWGAAELIKDDSERAFTPQLVFDDQGNGLLSWKQNGEIWVKRFNGSLWSAGEQIPAYNDDSVQDVTLAIDSSGKALVAWRLNGDTYDIGVNRFDGTQWEPAKLIESDDVNSAEIPILALDSNGHALVVWLLEDNNKTNFWASRFE